MQKCFVIFEKIMNVKVNHKKSNVTLNTEGEEKDSEYMKSTEFLSKLNESQTPAVWEFRTGENNRYPVFIKTDE